MQEIPLRIPLHARDGSIRAYALIDIADAKIADGNAWCLDSDGYAIGGYPRRSLHREICGLAKGDPLQVDHINRNKLDNRRANLRVVDWQTNQQNKPGYGRSQHRGVVWNRKSEKWQSQAMLDGKSYYFGLYDNELEAARVASAWRAEHMPGAVETLIEQ